MLQEYAGLTSIPAELSLLAVGGEQRTATDSITPLHAFRAKQARYGHVACRFSNAA
ncbi:MAG: hypothetical protein ACLPT4_03295 [Verrucomicrobiia bacterium]